MLNDPAQQRQPLQRPLDVVWKQGSGRLVPTGDGSVGQLEHGERQTPADGADLFHRRLVQRFEPVRQQPPDSAVVERGKVDPGADSAREQAGDHLLKGRRLRGPGGEDQQHGFVDGTAGEVVQQPQGRLVRLVQVVDQEQQPMAGRDQPEQFRDRDEQALVRGLPTPGDLTAGHCPLDLLAVVVVETVQQRRVAPAHVAHCLEHRRVGPRTLDRRGRPAPGPPSPFVGQ